MCSHASEEYHLVVCIPTDSYSCSDLQLLKTHEYCTAIMFANYNIKTIFVLSRNAVESISRNRHTCIRGHLKTLIIHSECNIRVKIKLRLNSTIHHIQCI